MIGCTSKTKNAPRNDATTNPITLNSDSGLLSGEVWSYVETGKVADMRPMAIDGTCVSESTLLKRGGQQVRLAPAFLPAGFRMVESDSYALQTILYNRHKRRLQHRLDSFVLPASRRVQWLALPVTVRKEWLRCLRCLLSSFPGRTADTSVNPFARLCEWTGL